jgi:hypothetical protein
MTTTESVTEGAEKLMASAERSGGIKLAELSQAELCVLRAETASLVCEQTARWWARLGERRRELVGGLALDFLVWRGALHLPEGANPVQMYEDDQRTNEHLGPELAVILAARRGPRPLAVCQVPRWDEFAWCHPPLLRHHQSRRKAAGPGLRGVVWPGRSPARRAGLRQHPSLHADDSGKSSEDDHFLGGGHPPEKAPQGITDRDAGVSCRWGRRYSGRGRNYHRTHVRA